MMWCMCSNSRKYYFCVGGYRHANSRETTLAKIADTFKERIIPRHSNQYSEIIIGGT